MLQGIFGFMLLCVYFLYLIAFAAHRDENGDK